MEVPTVTVRMPDGTDREMKAHYELGVQSFPSQYTYPQGSRLVPSDSAQWIFDEVIGRPAWYARPRR